MKKVQQNRDIKLATTERRSNYLVSEPIYHTKKFFTKYLLAIDIRKAEILMNKPVYLGLLILELSKVLMCKFWYDYVFEIVILSHFNLLNVSKNGKL